MEKKKLNRNKRKGIYNNYTKKQCIKKKTITENKFQKLYTYICFISPTQIHLKKQYPIYDISGKYQC